MSALCGLVEARKMKDDGAIVHLYVLGGGDEDCRLALRARIGHGHHTKIQNNISAKGKGVGLNHTRDHHFQPLETTDILTPISNRPSVPLSIPHSPQFIHLLTHSLTQSTDPLLPPSLSSFPIPVAAPYPPLLPRRRKSVHHLLVSNPLLVLGVPSSSAPWQKTTSMCMCMSITRPSRSSPVVDMPRRVTIVMHGPEHHGECIQASQQGPEVGRCVQGGLLLWQLIEAGLGLAPWRGDGRPDPYPDPS